MAQPLGEHDNDEMNHEIEDSEAQENAPNFNAAWNTADTTLLHPGRLDRTKPLRAWERKPASPFTRQRVRVGKVWKRAISGKKGAMEITQAEPRTMKRLRAGEGTQSPLKIVKRLCLGSNDGVGLSWDRIESPRKSERRIVTRSSAAAEELVALSEEEDIETTADALIEDNGEDEDEEVEGTIVEFLDEEGRALDAEHGAEDGWADVDVPGVDALRGDATQYLSNAVEDTPYIVPTDAEAGDSGPDTSEEVPEGTSSNDAPSGDAQERTEEVSNPVPSTEAAYRAEAAVLAVDECALPDGFVSPAKRRRPTDRRARSQRAETRRRQTLPLAFAPGEPSNPTPEEEAHEGAETVTDVDHPKVMDIEISEGLDDPTEVHGNGANDAESIEQEPQEEWQDVSDDELAVNDETQVVKPLLDEDQTVPTAEISEGIVDSEMVDAMQVAQQSQEHALEILHKSFQRRKSTTPVRQRPLRTLGDAPHILAFTPVRNPHRYPSPPPSSFDALPALPTRERSGLEDAAADSPILLERSTSAPPEEPRMSPRRTVKPRISDDTAFIQAFLSRAEESKASRLASENKPTGRISAHKRESLSNRRDSDTVRQALASPAKAEVLGDLDPNGPSPKRLSEQANTPLLDGQTNLLSEKEDTEEKEDHKPRRRSIRDRRRPGRTTATSNTIALRGNHDAVVLKRSEAQELANATRANTRKNKGTSIMPTLRLTKLAAEKPSHDAETGAEGDESVLRFPPENVRGVRWDETLAYYQEAPIEPEPQFFELGDSGKALKLQGQNSDGPVAFEDDQSLPAPIPAAETPSKPKMRKLSTRRTAAAPGKTPAFAIASSDTAEPPSATKPKKKSIKKTHIATPGKVLDTPSEPALPPPPAFDLDASLLPKPDMTPQPKPAARKRLASRLPAPAPVAPPSSVRNAPSSFASSAAHSSSSLVHAASATEGQSLISSPAKRKGVPSATAIGPPNDSAVPRLTFGRGKLGYPARAASGIGLASPAKKASRSVGFGASGSENGIGGEGARNGLSKAPGLNSSPAKKRAKRPT